MSKQDSVFLVGPMGAGKTAVGLQLARDLGVEFLDSDAEIERRTGVDITFIFEKEGENGFREREKEVIADLAQRDNVVLATGGGAILAADNRRILGSRGIVVYLKTSVKHQLDRTQHNQKRPLLINDEPETVLTSLMKVRGPLYEKLANISVDTKGQRVKTVVKQIKTLLQQQDFTPLKK